MVTANIYSLSEYSEYDSAFWAESTELFDNKLLFFGLCTHNPGSSAGFFSFDITSNRSDLLFTIEEIVPTKKDHIPQGKIHTKIFKGLDNKFYFGTHFAYPNCVPQPIKYEGGYILAYDPITGAVDNHGIIIPGEGIVTLVLDSTRMHCYILTAPSFYFVDYDIESKKVVFTAKVAQHGSICRSLGLDTAGNVYGTSERYRVFKYDRSLRRLEFLDTNFETISEETAEWESPYKQGANRVGRTLWRCVEFDTVKNVFYGINASDSKMFEFNINTNTFTVIGNTIRSEFNRIYPTLTLTALDGIYYYFPSNGKFDYQLSEDIRSTSSLVSFDTESTMLTDYGQVLGSNNEIIYGAAAAMCPTKKNLYLLGAIETEESNLLSFSNKHFQLALIGIDLDVK